MPEITSATPPGAGGWRAPAPAPPGCWRGCWRPPGRTRPEMAGKRVGAELDLGPVPRGVLAGHLDRHRVVVVAAHPARPRACGRRWPGAPSRCRRRAPRRPGGEASRSESAARQSAVVGAVPVPKAMPGSRTTSTAPTGTSATHPGGPDEDPPHREGAEPLLPGLAPVLVGDLLHRAAQRLGRLPGRVRSPNQPTSTARPAGGAAPGMGVARRPAPRRPGRPGPRARRS